MLSIYTALYALHVPIFQHDTRCFPSPILRIYLQGLSCLPWVFRMNHRLWEKRRYHRRKTQLQLHQSCSRPFWHETFVHIAVYGSGISAEWKTCGILALAYRQEREPFYCCCNDWLLHMSFQWSSWSGAQFPRQWRYRSRASLLPEIKKENVNRISWGTDEQLFYDPLLFLQ